MGSNWRKNLTELHDDILDDIHCGTVEVEEILSRIQSILRGAPSPRWPRKTFGAA